MKFLSALLYIFFCAFPAYALSQSACQLEPDSHTQVLTGSIDRSNFESYVEVPFYVPEGTKSIGVHFSYDRENRTTIDLGLLDINGFRGWSGGNKNQFKLTENDSTPSFSAGPIDAGTWQILLGVPNVREEVTANYEITISLSCLLNPSDTLSKANRGEDWYVGDLHAHSGHSDGSCTSLSGERIPCPIFKSLEVASNRGLDFLAISDHNSVSQNQSNEELSNYFDSLLLIPAREITTFYGHANVFGTTEFIDFRLQQRGPKNAKFLHDQVDSLSAVLSINHPGSPSGEDCMGCGWILNDTDFSRVTAIEVVNVGFVDLPRGKAHIKFWHDRLNEGYQLTGIGGSDNHDASRPSEQPSAIGNPRTWIKAKSLSVRGLLDGIESGNVYIDTTGGKISLAAFELAGAVMGDTLNISQMTKLETALSWESELALDVRWIHQGEEITAQNIEVNNSDYQAEIAVTELTIPGWIRMDLIDEANGLKLIGNPVYLTR